MKLTIEPLLTAQQVAAWLQVSEWRVYDLVRQGILPHVRLGARQVRFEPNKIRKWLEQGGSHMENGRN